MFPKSVFCIASTSQQAAIVRELLDVGFTRADIFVLASDDAAAPEAAREMGIPAPEAKRHEGRVQAGYVLISVLSGNDAEVEHAQQIYEQAGAKGISTSRLIR